MRSTAPRGCRRIDVLQPCPVGSPPPAGADGASRSHDDRTAQRRPVKSFSIRAPMPVSPTPAQARSAESVDQADSERQERPDCVNRNEPGKQGCTMPTSVPTSVPGRIAWPAHAGAGSCRCRPQEWPGCHQPIVVHRRWRHTRTGRRRHRRRPARIAVPCSPASRSTIEHLGRRSRSVSPVQAGVGVTRLMFSTACRGRDCRRQGGRTCGSGSAIGVTARRRA